MSKNNMSKFSFITPAVNKIKVHGDLKASLSERLSGLQITKEISGDLDSVSVLIGQIKIRRLCLVYLTHSTKIILRSYL